ncbi:MAG: DNA mismatch repair endonuclease MutL [Ruminococcaceae bacterium]|nr:DNA mismatch repair endonuclease MutL [Oscillospiraceae bacterium]
MGKINLLSFEIANLIAAGEVVERPSSVLKELIENSIDSGATSIVAEIKRGGVSIIRVSDNGCGIDKDDLPIALKRHATSKIRDKDDLNSIMTLGFRGEALAAIASVSELSIISKTKDCEFGTMLTSEAGNVVDISEVGCADGTTVVVENLFYNVPARRKFLKKDSTEAQNVCALVEKVALSRPDISIQLLVDGEEKFKTPGNSDLIQTISAVFGREFASKLIKTEGEANGIKIFGYIGRSDNTRKNRNLENIFINGRFVKSLTAMAALEKAFTSYIAPECFPTCVLFVEMNPGTVDVNVHPAKLEVKFSDERVVFEAIYYTVKNALENHEYRPELALGAKRGNESNFIGAFVPIGADTKGEQISIRPSVNFSEIKQTPTQNAPSVTKNSAYDKPIIFGSGAGKSTFSNSGFEKTSATSSVGATTNSYSQSSSSMTPKDSIELLQRYRDAKPVTEEQKQSKMPEIVNYAKSENVSLEENISDYKIIGEAFDCYVLVEYDGALLVIDKHAAHERVIFEDLKKNREIDGRVASQSLLLPITVILTPEEISAAEDCRDEIISVGFEYSIDRKAADITAIPDAISASDAEELFVKMLDEAIDGKGNPTITDSIRRERALYQIACKAAIKGGRKYDKSIVDWLVKKILLLPDITVCPHGRPIAYKLTKQELDRQFDRIK